MFSKNKRKSARMTRKTFHGLVSSSAFSAVVPFRKSPKRPTALEKLDVLARGREPRRRQHNSLFEDVN